MKSRSRRVPGVARESGMSSIVLSCNIRSFVIDIDYSYRYLHELYSELSEYFLMSWLYFYSMFTLHECPVLEIVSLPIIEFYQLF